MSNFDLLPDEASPALTDKVFSGRGTGSGAERKSTHTAIRNLYRLLYDTLYQATLTSGTNIKTINGQSVLGSGDLTVSGGGGGGDVTQTGTQTLTNKRITKRVSTLTTTATLTPNIDSFDSIKITAQSGNLSIATPTGTPTDDQATLISVRAIGGPCQITVSSGYSIPSGSSFASPYTLASGTRIRFALIYDTASGKHDIMTASPGLP